MRKVPDLQQSRERKISDAFCLALVQGSHSEVTRSRGHDRSPDRSPRCERGSRAGALTSDRSDSDVAHHDRSMRRPITRSHPREKKGRAQEAYNPCTTPDLPTSRCFPYSPTPHGGWSSPVSLPRHHRLPSSTFFSTFFFCFCTDCRVLGRWHRCRVRRDARDFPSHQDPPQVTGSGTGVRRTTGAAIAHLIHRPPQDAAGHRLWHRRRPSLYAAGRRLRYGQHSGTGNTQASRRSSRYVAGRRPWYWPTADVDSGTGAAHLNTLLVADPGTGPLLMPTLALAPPISIRRRSPPGTCPLLMPTLALASPISIHRWSPTLVLAHC